MESEENTSILESDNLMSERRQRVLARLEARRVLQTSEMKTASAAAATDFDKLLEKATNMVNTPESSITQEFLQELEAALTLIPRGHHLRRLKEALNMLRGRMQAQVGLADHKAAFSFSAGKVAAESRKSDEEKETSSECDPLGPSQPRNKSLSEKSVTVSGKRGEEIVVDGVDGEEVVITGIASCLVRVPFKASTVYMKSVNYTTLVFAPVRASVLVRDCEHLTIAAAAQQIRIHNCHHMQLYVEVRGAVVIEDSDGVEVAPYNVTGIRRDQHNHNWSKVQDFNWLSPEAQSPNWKIMTENHTKCFTL